MSSEDRRLHHQLEVGLTSHSATKELVHHVVAIREVVAFEDDTLCVAFDPANGDLISEYPTVVGNVAEIAAHLVLCAGIPRGGWAWAYASVMALSGGELISGGSDTQSLRVATWNSGMALKREPQVLAELAADAVVLQGVAAAELDGLEGHLFAGPPSSGLAVVPFNGWSFTPSVEDPQLPGLLYCQVLDPAGKHVADLAGVWALTGRDVASYTEQFAAILSFVATRQSTQPLIIAGDFNASAQGPNMTAHAANVETARQLGLVSAYHQANGIPHGQEPTMTLRWWGKGGEECGYHCDFIFCGQQLAGPNTSASVGDWATWVESERSDHAPVIATLAI